MEAEDQMRTLMCWFAVTIAVAAVAFAQEFGPTRVSPADLQWGETPGEVTFVDIAGDNETPGLYAYRVRFPDRFRNEAHFHPDDRLVTVMSGTLHMGYRNQFDEDALRALPAGSVWTEPANQTHFVWAQNGEVIIQVVGVGPSGTTQFER